MRHRQFMASNGGIVIDDVGLVASRGVSEVQIAAGATNAIVETVEVRRVITGRCGEK